MQYSLDSVNALSNPDRAQQVISDLDSELNAFTDALPDHCA